MTNSERTKGSSAEIGDQENLTMNTESVGTGEVDLEAGEATILEDEAITAPEARRDENLTVIVEDEDSGMDVETGDSTDGVALNPSSSADTTQVNNTGARPRLMRGMQRESTRWGMYTSQRHLLRKSTAVSLATGMEGGKETTVEEVMSHQEAMNPTERRVSQILGLIGGREHEEQAMSEAATVAPKHYRLTARNVSKSSVTNMNDGTRLIFFMHTCSSHHTDTTPSQLYGNYCGHTRRL